MEMLIASLRERCIRVPMKFQPSEQASVCIVADVLMFTPP